jgi:tetratricopeptide (TPR) repeat protein
LLAESERLAVACDDRALEVAAALATGDVLFEAGRKDADTAYTRAAEAAEAAGDARLVALCSVAVARKAVLSRQTDKTAAEKAVNNITRALPALTAPSERARAFSALALACKALGRYDEALQHLSAAFAIHTEAAMLKDAAYDRYIAASVYSVRRQFTDARAALHDAIAYDRRAENSRGLGMDYRALGAVERKAGNTPNAKAAYLRSAAIFRAAGNKAEATRSETAANNITLTNKKQPPTSAVTPHHKPPL